MPPSTRFRNLTPPKYAAALGERLKRVVLEERLAHFIEWLSQTKQVELVLWTDGQQRRLTYEEMDEVVKEYVNT